MSTQQNSSTYVGVNGDLWLAKDPRWDIDAIIDANFDPEAFIETLPEEGETPLPQMLRDAVYFGVGLMLDEVYMFFKAFDRIPGSVDFPNDDYPAKYLPQNGGSKNGRK